MLVNEPPPPSPLAMFVPMQSIWAQNMVHIIGALEFCLFVLCQYINNNICARQSLSDLKK